MRDIRISVAMATYNGERYLREQLNSIYSQTRIPDEVVVCDDLSTDKTCEILKEYHEHYGLKYIVNESNLGVNKNFEKAIRNCTGDYIAISDQDDVWMPNKVETSLNKIMEIEEGGDKPACVSSQSYGVDRYLRVINKKHKIQYDSSGFKATILQNGVCQGCSLMINRKLVSLLKAFPKKGFMYDYYIGLVAAAIGNKYNISEPLMLYRHHSNNVIAREDKTPHLISRIIAHLKMWKYSTMFEYSVFQYSEHIKQLYKELIPKGNAMIIDRLQIYESDGLCGKLLYILKEDYFTAIKRFKFAVCLVFTSWMPLKNDKKNITIEY